MLRNARKTQYLAIAGIFVILMQLFSVPVQAIRPSECSDGLDNDVDGVIDYPFDHDCDSPHDDTEGVVKRDLYVTLSDGRDSVEAGANMTYTLGLRTDSGSPQLITARFYIPDFVTVVTAGEDGRVEGDMVIWRNVLVQPGYIKSLQAHVHINGVAEENDLLIAEAYVGDIRVTDTTKIIKGGDMRVPMEIFVDDGRIFAEPGEVLNYKIIVKNTFGADREFTLRTQLPPALSFLGASGDYKRVNRSVEWYNQFLPAGAEIVYELDTEIGRETVEFGMIRLKAASEAAYGTDTTTILYEKLPPASIDVTVNDGFQTSKAGQELDYEIVIKNNRAKLIQGIDVKNAIPVYTEFVDASEGGYWNGKDVYWKNVTVSPHGSRILYVTARVRSDAPIGAALRNRVLVDGKEAVDQTVVDEKARKTGENLRSNPDFSNVLLRKTAERNEVRPGDTVRFTIFLRNVLDYPVSNIVVEDRIDVRYFEVVNAEGGVMSDGRIVWEIPELNPGESWQTDYAVRVAPDVPHGTEIANVVTVQGEGFENVSLSERVRTSSIGVVDRLPKSGAPLDVLFTGLLLGFSGVSTVLFRRRSSIERAQ